MRFAWLGVALLLSAPGFAAEIDNLKQQLAHEEDGKAEDAAKRLGELGDAKAIDVLLDGLAVGASSKVQAAMLGALAGKKDTRAVEVLK